MCSTAARLMGMRLFCPEGRRGVWRMIQPPTAHQAAATPARGMVPLASRLTAVLAEAIRQEASDIHLAEGQAPFLRVDGALSAWGTASLPESGRPLAAWAEQEPLSAADMEDFLGCFLTETEHAALQRERQLDFSLTAQGRRFRAHAYSQKGAWALALRLLPQRIPPLASLGVPMALSSLLSAGDGLILVGGRTGSGKSTTLASFIEEMNRQRAAHIITLEDPIEYEFLPKRCFISQRALGRDFLSFPAGLRSALREDPDVIFVGEIREPETVRITLQAAETGCLVLATLHTKDAAEAALRLEGMFSGEEQAQIRSQLSLVLRAVFSQRLLAAASGGRVLAAEALVAVPAVRNLIRAGKVAQLRDAILAGRAAGMQTLAQSVEELFRAGKIARATWEEALASC